MSGFKKFLLRGSLVDLADALVIGVALAGLVKDLITPLIAAIGGKPDFANLYFTNQLLEVPVRRLHQSADLVPHRRGRDVLSGRAALQRASRALQADPGTARGGSRLPALPLVDPCGRERVLVLHA